MIAVSTTPSPTAGTFAAPPDAPVYAVVGFDGGVDVGAGQTRFDVKSSHCLMLLG